MQTRLNWSQVAPNALQTLLDFGQYVEKSGLEQSLIDLVNLRASQINHCAYCIDMHFKDARASGETEQRLYGLDAWRETTYYTDRERAALAWTEAVTVLTDGFVPDEVYEQARAQFSEAEMVALTMNIAQINTWNRINVSFRNKAGWYQSRRELDPTRVQPSANGVK